jgi:hypothetical protein
MSLFVIVAIGVVAIAVVLFVVKGPDLGSGERSDGSDHSPGPSVSDGPPSVGGGDGGAGGVG